VGVIDFGDGADHFNGGANVRWSGRMPIH